MKGAEKMKKPSWMSEPEWANLQAEWEEDRTPEFDRKMNLDYMSSSRIASKGVEKMAQTIKFECRACKTMVPLTRIAFESQMLYCEPCANAIPSPRPSKRSGNSPAKASTEKRCGQPNRLRCAALSTRASAVGAASKGVRDEKR